MALMTLQQFRDKRDRFALDGYYIRWPILNNRRNSLRKRIDILKKLLDMPIKPLVLTLHIKGLEEDKYKLLAEYSEVVSEIAMIEQDAPLRKMNLGLMEIPNKPTLEQKQRLTVFLLQNGRDMLLKGIPE